MRVLVVDHMDSFVFNIVQGLGAAGAQVECLRSDRPLVEAVRTDPDAVVLSPGPGSPGDRRISGLSRHLLERWSSERPFLGICLGHQIIAEQFGGRVVRAPAPVHGDTSPVLHDGLGLFRDLPSPTSVARYHSLVVDPSRLPGTLCLTARDPSGLVMALRHTSRPVESVQFHPESYLTPEGPRMLGNFLRGART